MKTALNISDTRTLDILLSSMETCMKNALPLNLANHPFRGPKFADACEAGPPGENSMDVFLLAPVYRQLVRLWRRKETNPGMVLDSETQRSYGLKIWLRSTGKLGAPRYIGFPFCRMMGAKEYRDSIREYRAEEKRLRAALRRAPAKNNANELAALKRHMQLLPEAIQASA